MDYDRRVTEYIEDIPRAVEETLRRVDEQLAGWSRIAEDRLVLVGSGTSFNALTVACGHFARDRIDACVLTPDAWLRRGLPGHARPLLVVALSQSGQSAGTVAALRRAEALNLRTVALTAQAGSALAQSTQRALLLPVASEDAGPKTKGYAASLAALFVLADWLVDKSAGACVTRAQLARVVASTKEPARTLAAELDDVDFIAVAGEDRHFGTALEASLKIAEMAGVPAAGFPLEEMMHGRLQGLTARSVALFIATDDDQRSASLRAAQSVAQHGIRVSIVNLTGVATDHDWRLGDEWPAAPFDAIAAIVPFQHLAVALAERRGRPAHRMQFPGLSAQLGIRLDTA